MENEDKLEDEVQPVSEQSRREFMTKLVTVAGVVAVTGLAASSSADAALFIKFGKLQNGFRVNLTGREIGEAFKQIGIVGHGANLEKATITIEFSA
jgi:hypothetical protein